ncbi:GAF domain-containing sensor histidine kinase [Sediminicola sp. 1XM1-17]|uniref:GAF domain-containing sensor histidine kinase n=1 Tax=Sediminicola sp. 1XM1-17 TaxID=3127702 RepID=UPI003077F2ED
MLSNLNTNLRKDVDSINKITVVPNLLEVICKSTGMGFAAIARVTETNWVTCRVQDEINFGLKPGDELAIETTFCNQIRQHKKPVVINEVATDDKYKTHPIPLQYGFQSYISVPIYRRDGSFFGTLCAIDTRPAVIDTPEIRGMFKLYSELISFHLDAIEELDRVSAHLMEERKIAELRETFIAILGHDLRNPVSTTRMCADILLKLSKDETAIRQAEIIKATSYRMQGLIDNLLDFAMGHLGDGIKLEMTQDNSLLRKVLEQVLQEMKTLDSHRTIKDKIHLKKSVTCDLNRVAQLFSNLLGNAIKHGAENEPIEVDIHTTDRAFILSVSNAGTKISDSAMNNLFKPFFSENENRNKKSLGLGLYISSEIAKSHEGQLKADSNDERTTFTLSIPL